MYGLLFSLLGGRPLRKEGFIFGSQFKTIVHHTIESKVVELEAAGHDVSTTRKQTEMKPGVHFAFPFLFSPVSRMIHPCLGGSFHFY